MKKSSPSAKNTTIALLIGIGVLVVVLEASIVLSNLSAKAQPVEPARWTLPVGSFQPAYSVATPQVPAYPNVEDLGSVANENPFVQGFSYKTTDTKEQVFEFYSQNLQLQGWQPLASGTWYAAYEWRDNTGRLPYGLYLHVNLTNWYNNRILANIELSRWPEADRTPLYPGAKQVEYSQEQEKYGGVSRTITFIVEAMPKEVENYYKSRLVEYGWMFKADESRVPYLVFRSYYKVALMAKVRAFSNGQAEAKVYLEFTEDELPGAP